jgi:hypothetical protein
MEVLNDEYMCIQYGQERNILEIVWKPTTEKFSDTTFKTEFEGLTKMVLKYSPKVVLFDNRKFNFAMSPEIQAWTSQTFPVPAYECGVRKIAFLVGTDIFAQISVENSVDLGPKDKIETQYFDHIDKAQEWLRI